MKETFRAFASYLSVFGGLTVLGRQFGSRDGALILYGHRIAGDCEGYMQGLRPDWLEEQLAYLSRHYQFLSLSELLRHIEVGERVPSRSVVITMDDGFRDNYTQGLPLFKKYRVPATVFLTTGCLDSGELPWSQRLGCLFQQTTAETLRHPAAGRRPLPLVTKEDRKTAYRLVKEPMKKMGQVPREDLLLEFEALLETRAPKDRMMTWDMAREMMGAGVEMGGHTVSHSLLAYLDKDEATRELRLSKERLEAELNVKSPPFCFPAGSWTPELVGLARELGYRSVFTSKANLRWNQLKRVDTFSLSRIGLPNSRGLYLQAEIDGGLHNLRQAFRRAWKR